MSLRIARRCGPTRVGRAAGRSERPQGKLPRRSLSRRSTRGRGDPKALRRTGSVSAEQNWLLQRCYRDVGASRSRPGVSYGSPDDVVESAWVVPLADLRILEEGYVGLARDESDNLVGTLFEVAAIALLDLCPCDAAFRDARQKGGLDAFDWTGCNRDPALHGDFWRVFTKRTTQSLTDKSKDGIVQQDFECPSDLVTAATDWSRRLENDGLDVEIHTAFNMLWKTSRLRVVTPMGTLSCSVTPAERETLGEELPAVARATLRLVKGDVRLRGCSDAVAGLLEAHSLQLSWGESSIDICAGYANRFLPANRHRLAQMVAVCRGANKPKQALRKVQTSGSKKLDDWYSALTRPSGSWCTLARSKGKPALQSGYLGLDSDGEVRDSTFTR
ncbi:unnamed protein product [Parajaminaea phylloscopi]